MAAKNYVISVYRGDTDELADTITLSGDFGEVCDYAMWMCDRCTDRLGTPCYWEAEELD